MVAPGLELGSDYKAHGVFLPIQQTFFNETLSFPGPSCSAVNEVLVTAVSAEDGADTGVTVLPDAAGAVPETHTFLRTAVLMQWP